MRNKPTKISDRKGLYIPLLAALTCITALSTVTGTLAWYQYSALASASYIFTTAKATELLQIRVGEGDWKSSLTSADFTSYLGGTYGTAIQPISSTGVQARDADLNPLKANPRYQVTESDNWGDALTASYVTFPISFRVTDGTVSNGEAGLLNKDAPLYLSDFKIRNETSSALSSALRVHFANRTEGANKFILLSENGGTIDTHGNLDLNGDGALDTGVRYEWDTDTTPLVYGGSDATETSYAPSDVLGTVDADGSIRSGISLGTIPALGTLTLNVTLFLEGWQTLGEASSSMWDVATYTGIQLGVGLSFSIPKLA